MYLYHANTSEVSCLLLFSLPVLQCPEEEDHFRRYVVLTHMMVVGKEQGIRSGDKAINIATKIVIGASFLDKS